mgnify:CR=1 FL=1
MCRLKYYRGWGVYRLNAKEESEYGFKWAVIHPDNMGVPGLTPADTDWECDSLEEAANWIRNYDS